MVHSMQMVNAGFPQRVQYGFEMVDVRGRIRSITGSRHQSKIYAESNQSDYSQIFRDFTSMQTLAIYRRLLDQDPLRDQPQRRPEQPQRNKIEDGDGEMVFLLIMGFWVGLRRVRVSRHNTP